MVIKKTDIPFYTEGPVVDNEGNIFFTAPAAGAVYKMDATGNITEWARSAWPNGQVILSNGDHLICDSKLGVVRRFNKSGHWIGEETAVWFNQERVSTPNDLAVDTDGSIYFTDSIRHEGKVWLKEVEGNQKIIAANLDYPNGIVLCKNERCLYIAESYRNRILKISMAPPYEIIIFTELPQHASGKEENNLPDGLALDEFGNLWVAHYGMEAAYILNPEGRIIKTIKTTVPLTSNVFVIKEGHAIITGGYGEPGPGALLSVHL